MTWILDVGRGQSQESGCWSTEGTGSPLRGWGLPKGSVLLTSGLDSCDFPRYGAEW